MELYASAFARHVDEGYYRCKVTWSRHFTGFFVPDKDFVYGEYHCEV